MRTILRALTACLALFSLTAFADTQEPSVISGVRALGVSGPAIVVTWKAGQDNVGIEGYSIHRNKAWIATVKDGLRYEDYNIKSGVEYKYEVVAFDYAGNFSARFSDPATAASSVPATAQSASPPPSNTGLAAPSNLQTSVINSSTVRLSWTPPPGGADKYRINLDGGYFTTVQGTNQIIVNTLNTSRPFVFNVVALRGNLKSTNSSPISVNTGGNANSAAASSPPPPASSGKPAAPTGLRAEVQNNTSIKFAWNAPAGGADVYNVYVNGGFAASVQGSTEYIARGLQSGKSHSFYLHAYRSGQYSARSRTVTGTTGTATFSPPPPIYNAPPPPVNDAAAPPPPQNGNSAVPDGYSLVFQEEFDRMSIDSTKWNSGFMWGPDLFINQEEQYYVDVLYQPDFGISPFKFDGNTLTIEASRTPDWLLAKARNQKYLSGAMTTHQNFKMKYGYVEMRAKMPRGKGLWPAFWLLHEPGSTTGLRPEIDVLEQLGQFTQTVFQTYHWEENGRPFRSESFEAQGPNKEDYASGFHTFGLHWERGRLTWYIDGVRTTSFVSNKVPNEPMYLLMNLAIGGTWGPSPDANTQLPAQFQIDYIRAYKKRQ